MTFSSLRVNAHRKDGQTQTLELGLSCKSKIKASKVCQRACSPFSLLHFFLASGVNLHSPNDNQCVYVIVWSWVGDSI